MMAVICCPICQRPFNPDESPAMPFCSVRCKQIDLRRWLGETYGMPLEPDEDEPPPRHGEDEGP